MIQYPIHQILDTDLKVLIILQPHRSRRCCYANLKLYHQNNKYSLVLNFQHHSHTVSKRVVQWITLNHFRLQIQSTSSCLSLNIVRSLMLQKRLLWNFIEQQKSEYNLEKSRLDLHSILDLSLVYHISLMKIYRKCNEER